MPISIWYSNVASSYIRLLLLDLVIFVLGTSVQVSYILQLNTLK
jgi:hypothetical protein